MSSTENTSQQVSDRVSKIRERAKAYYHEVVKPKRVPKRKEGVAKSYDPEFRREYQRNYYASHREQIREYHKQLYAVSKQQKLSTVVSDMLNKDGRACLSSDDSVPRRQNF